MAGMYGDTFLSYGSCFTGIADYGDCFTGIGPRQLSGLLGRLLGAVPGDWT